MPEEQNRILIDHVSDYLFCPTDRALTQRKSEGLKVRIYDRGCDADLLVKYQDKFLKPAFLQTITYHTGSTSLPSIEPKLWFQQSSQARMITTTVSMPLKLFSSSAHEKKIKEFGVEVDDFVCVGPQGYANAVVIIKRTPFIHGFWWSPERGFFHRCRTTTYTILLVGGTLLAE